VGRSRGDLVSITLLPTLDAPGIARRFAGEAAEADFVGSDREVLELLVSEVVSDAVTHRSAWLNLGIEPGGLTRVEVIDSVSPDTGFGAGSRSGLEQRVLDALATRWGVEPCAQGRKMWFELRASA
jgi:hypothetical protein